MEFLTSIEGISCILVSLLIIAGGINELVYFNKTSKATIKGYKELKREVAKW